MVDKGGSGPPWSTKKHFPDANFENLAECRECSTQFLIPQAEKVHQDRKSEAKNAAEAARAAATATIATHAKQPAVAAAPATPAPSDSQDPQGPQKHRGSPCPLDSQDQ